MLAYNETASEGEDLHFYGMDIQRVDGDIGFVKTGRPWLALWIEGKNMIGTEVKSLSGKNFFAYAIKPGKRQK